MRVVRFIAAVLAGIGGVCTVLMMLQIVADVLSRWIFNTPISGTMEVVSVYYLVPLTFLPLAMVELADRHIVVKLFVQLLPERVQKWLGYFTGLIALVFAGWLTWAALLEAVAGYRMGEVIETAAQVMSIWPSRFIVAIGIGFMGLILALEFFGEVKERPNTPSEIDESVG